MLQELRAWLNGDREYFSGVVLFAKVGDNDALKSLFAKAKTDYCYQRLQDELLKICKQLKFQSNEYTNGNIYVPSESRTTSCNFVELQHSNRVRKQEDGHILPVNIELFQACKNEADRRYKEVMNLRAELFALARHDNFSDVNTPDRIAQRSKLAVDIAEGFKRVSQLYDKADYVKLHGRLPDDGATGDDEELQPDNIPDHLVKQSLDNLRKNVNKMKKREQTPERLQLLQTHEANTKKLEARWRLLQPAN